jgi:hypothetical protein
VRRRSKVRPPRSFCEADLANHYVFVVDTSFLCHFWDRCYDFLNIFDKKLGKKLAFFTQNKAKLCKRVIITFFRQKLSKIAENCDPNIDPWIYILGRIRRLMFIHMYLQNHNTDARLIHR